MRCLLLVDGWLLLVVCRCLLWARSCLLKRCVVFCVRWLLFVVRGCRRLFWYVRLLCVVCCVGGCVSFVVVCRLLIGVSCGSLLCIV